LSSFFAIIFAKNLIEMRRAEGIVAVSIPFTAGVASAAMLQPGGGENGLWIALCCSAILAFLFPLACMKGRRQVPILGVYFILGVLCHTSALYGIQLKPAPSWIREALSGFCNLIDSIDFRNSTTGPLVKALLTGQRDGMDRSIVESFRASGASHILALSGLHLGILYGILGKMLSFTGNSRPARIIKSTVIIAFSTFYFIITGAAPSLVRAFLFITIGELSRLLPGRRRSNMNTYCMALTIQLCVNPLSISSLGFQLSYLAMLGIFIVFPKINAWYPPSSRFDPLRFIWTSMSMSISCQVFTAPLVWLRFKSFPVYFLLTNLISLPLTELLVISAVVTVLLSAAGCCPDIAKSLTDFLGQTLISALNIIGSM